MAGLNKQFNVSIHNDFNENIMVKISPERLSETTPTDGFRRVTQADPSTLFLDVPSKTNTVYVYINSESGSQLATGFPIGTVPSKITVTADGTVEWDRFQATTSQVKGGGRKYASSTNRNDGMEDVYMAADSSCSAACIDCFCCFPRCLYQCFCVCEDCDCDGGDGGNGGNGDCGDCDCDCSD